MATAKKLPSGSWRCKVFSHKEKIWDDHNQQWKDKLIYASFTSDDKTLKGKKEVELRAAEFAASKQKKKLSNSGMTLGEAVDNYIQSCDGVLAASTIHGYRKIRRTAFQDIMDIKLRDLDHETLRNAVNMESKRKIGNKKDKTISAKTVKNNYGLITAAINTYYPGVNCTVKLPQRETIIKELPNPEDVINAFRGDRLELAVLLAIWLSFSMSEIRGLTKSKSIYNDEYIVVSEVLVKVGKEDKLKKQGKKETRNRMHKIPAHIKKLIDNVEGDVLVPFSADAIYGHFKRVLKRNNIPHISFHDLRHLNASVMAMLRVPEKYALERGGWKTDSVMKRVYTHTFSDERERVDHTIDEYFENIINPENKKQTIYNEDTLRLLKEANSNGQFDALINAIFHEIFHEK